MNPTVVQISDVKLYSRNARTRLTHNFCLTALPTLKDKGSRVVVSCGVAIEDNFYFRLVQSSCEICASNLLSSINLHIFQEYCITPSLSLSAFLIRRFSAVFLY